MSKSSQLSSKLSLIEEDLTNFYEYCKDLGLKPHEIRQVCSSLYPARKKILLIAKILMIVIVLIAVFYVLAQFEYFEWHFSAIGRIIMIKLLPFYNWEKLRYSKCLIDGAEVNIKLDFDCYYCETIANIAYSDENDPEFLKLNFLDLNIPVIFIENPPSTDETTANSSNSGFVTTTDSYEPITEAPHQIPDSQHSKFGEKIEELRITDESHPITDVPQRLTDSPSKSSEVTNSSTDQLLAITDFVNIILKDDIFYETAPCKLASNLPSTSGRSIADVLSQTDSYAKFFMHFQNCDFNSVKALRRVFPRPKHYFDEVAPVQYSWMVMSKNYGGGRFKRIELQDKLTSFKQIIGRNYVRLYPVNDCVDECRVLESYLEPGEVLYFTSLWELEYKASEEEENLAVIFETHY